MSEFSPGKLRYSGWEFVATWFPSHVKVKSTVIAKEATMPKGPTMTKWCGYRTLYVVWLLCDSVWHYVCNLPPPPNPPTTPQVFSCAWGDRDMVSNRFLELITLYLCASSKRGQSCSVVVGYLRQVDPKVCDDVSSLRFLVAVWEAQSTTQYAGCVL